MAVSRKTCTFRNNTGRAVNDLHVRWGGNAVEVIGVDGVSPDDPKAGSTLEESGGQSDLSDIDVNAGESIKVRIRTPRRRAPPARGVRYVWTRNGAPLARPQTLASLEEAPDEAQPALVAVELLEKRLSELADRLELVELGKDCREIGDLRDRAPPPERRGGQPCRARLSAGAWSRSARP